MIVALCQGRNPLVSYIAFDSNYNIHMQACRKQFGHAARYGEVIVSPLFSGEVSNYCFCE